MGRIRSVWEFLIPLVSERNDKGLYKRASLGRVAFWITFIIAIYVWIFTTGDIQASHLQMLYITATYNLMKRASWFKDETPPLGGDDYYNSYNNDPYNDHQPRI